MHAHLIFNSVNLVTGMKYEYRKGEWKRRMQPITNKLCKEYNLEIMPAEYAREPKNLSRVEWEQEQQFKEMILADALFCQNYAGSMDHFIFLMKRIGYQFEYGKYFFVKVPGGKWYHQLDKLDERFGEENFKYYLDMGFSRPRFISTNPLYLYRSGLSGFQLKFYHKMYRICMVEQKRFDKNAAWMAKELQKFHQLQKEYLFLVNNDIKSVEGLVTYEVLKEMDVAKLVYKGMRANFIKQRAEEIVEAINSMGLSYPRLTDKEKAELFRFLPDDNNYNLELHMAVLKVCGMKLEFDEVYEDYQRIYDKTMEMQGEKKNERGESGRGRAR